MGIWRRLAIAGVVVGIAGVATGRAEAQRLPDGVRPEHYSLVITPDLKAATFAGSETIDVVLDAPATAIMLNAAEIEFVSVKAWNREQGSGISKDRTVQMRGFLAPIKMTSRRQMQLRRFWAPPRMTNLAMV